MFEQDDTFTRLPKIEDKAFDIIITDPPYDLDDKEKTYLHEQFLRISKGWVIIFAPPKNQWILPADQYGFWMKPESTKNASKSYPNRVEMLFFYREGAWNTDRHFSQTSSNVFRDLVDRKDLHPHRKPPSLIERLILNDKE